MNLSRVHSMVDALRIELAAKAEEQDIVPSQLGPCRVCRARPEIFWGRNSKKFMAMHAIGYSCTRQNVQGATRREVERKWNELHTDTPAPLLPQTRRERERARETVEVQS